MPYNEPDDMHLYDSDPRSPNYDASADDYAEQVEAEIRSALVNGWSETDDGQHDTPKEAFAQWLVDEHDNENVKTYHYQREMLGDNHEDTRSTRTDLVNEFMDHRGDV